jgi:hypothetical protein
MQHLHWFPYLQYSLTCGIAAPQLKQGSSLGMVTAWVTEEFCVRFRAKAKSLQYSKAARPALWPTHPCIHLIQTDLTSDHAANHSHEVPR